MSRRLGPISRKDLISALKERGWAGPTDGGKHQMMYKGKHKLVMPNPHRGDIGGDLLVVILKQAGISRDEWLDATRQSRARRE